MTVDVVNNGRPLYAVIVFPPSIFLIDYEIEGTVVREIWREKAKVSKYPAMPANCRYMYLELSPSWDVIEVVP